MARRKPRPSEVVHWMRVLSGEQIRRHRKRRGLTQRELAFLVKRSQTTIYLIESGQMVTLSESLALDLAKRLDMPWEDLFEARSSSRASRMTGDAHSGAHQASA